jgi:hypothetical protein
MDAVMATVMDAGMAKAMGMAMETVTAAVTTESR